MVINNVSSISSAFVTLTYSRTENSLCTWKRVGVDVNRFVQKIRRILSCDLEYLRVYESHKDGYPHVHLLLLIRREIANVRNSKFVADIFYKRFKGAWSHGHSDWKLPRFKNNNRVVSYVLKYIGKSSSTASLWTRILQGKLLSSPPDGASAPAPFLAGDNVWYCIWNIVEKQEYIDRCTFDYKKIRIKLVVWSRGFVDLYKETSL